MKPQQVQGKVVIMMGFKGKAPRSSEDPVVNNKPTSMVNFYSFLTTISVPDHTKLGSGQNLCHFFILKNMLFSHTLKVCSISFTHLQRPPKICLSKRNYEFFFS